jgi:parallel beta-helix repeat protein
MSISPLRNRAARRARPARPRLSLIALEDRVVPSTFTVDDDFTGNNPALRQYKTISAAVAAASAGDTIKVNPGTYNEVVTVNKRLTLLGSGPAVAKNRTGDPNTEAVIQGGGSAVSADPLGLVNLRANDIVFKGFTVQGNTQGPGMFTDPKSSGYDIEGNLIRSNNSPTDPLYTGGGLNLNSNGGHLTVLRGNAFENHTAESAGDGVFTELTVRNAVIDHNYFTGNVHYSVDFAGAPGNAPFPGFNGSYPPSANVTITNNAVEASGGFLVQYADQIVVSNNTITQATRTGIYVGGDVHGVTVSNNTLNGAADVNNAYYIGRHTGIFIGTLDIPGPIQGVTVSGNTITGYRNGIWLAGDPTTGAVSGVTVESNTVQNSSDPNGNANPDPYGYGILLWDANNNTIRYNQVTGNTSGGIYVNAASTGNTFTGNTATGNGGYDLHDASTGNGTGGTADTWSGNTFGTAYPPGLG